MEKKTVKIKVWKEGKNVLVRNDEFHINTYGKNLDDALKNFEEAYLLVIGESKQPHQKPMQNVTLAIEYPLNIVSQKKKQRIAIKTA